MADLSGKTVVILATHMVEESELVDTQRLLADLDPAAVAQAEEVSAARPPPR